MPDLRQRWPPSQRAAPAVGTRHRVVDREKAAAGLGCCEPRVGRLAEIDPGQRPEGIGVTFVGRDLLARQQKDPGVSSGPGELGMVGDAVVVGCLLYTSDA